MDPSLPVLAARGMQVVPRGARVVDEGGALIVEWARPVIRPDSPPLTALTTSGRPWRHLWNLPDRVVIDLLDTAVVEVRDADGHVTFDRELPPDVEQHLLLDHVLPLALARRGWLVLHGAVLAIDRRAVVLLGPSGAGKSTLTVFAGLHGWSVGGDDGAVVALGPPVTVEPTYPTARLTPQATELLGIPADEGLQIMGKQRLPTGGGAPFRPEPTELALVAVVDPVPAGQPAGLAELQGVDAHAALFGATFHADLGGGPLLRQVVDGLAGVADAATVTRLSVPRGRDGLVAAERLLRSAATA